MRFLLFSAVCTNLWCRKCYCGYGPMQVDLIPACLDCEHRCCQFCPKRSPRIYPHGNATIIHRSQRMQLSGEEGILCNKCSEIKVHDRFGLDASEMLAGASGGCPLCRLVLFVLLDSHESVRGRVEMTVDRSKDKIFCAAKALPRNIALDVIFETLPEKQNVVASPTVIAGKRLDGQYTTSIGALSEACGVPGPLGFKGSHRHIEGGLDSDTSYAQLGSWLWDCVDNHFTCIQKSDYSPPSRLLEICGDKIYLRDNQELACRNVQYAALSYRWGTTNFLTTTTESLPTHKDGIHTDSLPRTLKDAVRVAQGLKILFIWIDSLCIIQDSTEDRTVEFQRMGDYYHYSLITISILDSPEADAGFLDSRTPFPTVKVALDTMVLIRPALPPRGQILREAELSQRGWTVQERLLSTRIVHYSRNELFWECLCGTAREGSFEVQIGRDDPDDGTSLSAARRLLAKSNSDIATAATAFETWYRVSQEYSRRSLTDPSDRIPAIAGIAALIRARTGSEYIHSMFSGDLAGLVWYTESQYTDKKELLDYNSFIMSRRHEPSWSWIPTGQSPDPIFFPFLDQFRSPSPYDAKYIRHSQGIGQTQLTLRARLKRVVPGQKSSNREQRLVDYKQTNICSLLSPNEISPESAKGNMMSVMWICQWSHETTRHLSLCTCNSKFVEEMVAYLLVIVKDNRAPALWKRIGLGVAYDAPTCSNIDNRFQFDDSELEEITLV